MANNDAPVGGSGSGSSGLQVKSASWSALDGSGGKLVTGNVNAVLQAELAQGQPLSIFVGTSTLGTDPAYLHQKRLIISYVYNGVLGSVYGNDGSTITISANSGPLAIISASYQTASGSGSADVTALLSGLINNGSLSMTISNGNLGGDPAPYQPKVLDVNYTWYGNPEEVVVPEGATLNLPSPGTVKVSSALYQAQDGSGLSDVTAIIQGLAADQWNTLQVSVDPTTLQGDPAYRHVKNLIINYSVNGVAQSGVAQDGGMLNLPGLSIISATYEALDGSGSNDVTSILCGLMTPTGFQCTASPQVLGGDPASGHHKVLHVQYVANGIMQEVSVPDFGTFSIPPLPGTLAITYATYETLDESQSSDVTHIVSNLLVNNTLNVSVVPSALGGDPAPNIVKQLTVGYVQNGVEDIAVAQDFGSITLPLAPEVDPQPTPAPYVPASIPPSILTDSLQSASGAGNYSFRIEHKAPLIEYNLGKRVKFSFSTKMYAAVGLTYQPQKHNWTGGASGNAELEGEVVYGFSKRYGFNFIQVFGPGYAFTASTAVSAGISGKFKAFTQFTGYGNMWWIDDAFNRYVQYELTAVIGVTAEAGPKVSVEVPFGRDTEFDKVEASATGQIIYSGTCHIHLDYIQRPNNATDSSMDNHVRPMEHTFKDNHDGFSWHLFSDVSNSNLSWAGQLKIAISNYQHVFTIGGPIHVFQDVHGSYSSTGDPTAYIWHSSDPSAPEP